MRILSLGGIGILNPRDLPDLDSQKGQVLKYMLDQKWHAGPDIVFVAGGSEGLRRLRELRTMPHISIDRKRITERRCFAYRLTIGERQQELFNG